MSETEELTGVREREAFLGYERREPVEPPKPEAKTYEGADGVTEAANDLTAARRAAGGEPNEPEKLYYLDGEKKSVTAEQAAHDLSVYHAQQRTAEDQANLANLQEEVDAVRAAVYGQQPQQSAERSQAEAPQESLQSESTPVDEQSGVDPDIAAALAQPKVRAAIEAQVMEAAQAAKVYKDALAHNALTTAAYLMADIEEFKGLSLEQAAAQMQILQTQQPQRAWEIQQRLQAPRAMMEEANRLEQQSRARQAQVQQQQWQQFTKAHDDAFAKAVAKDGPEVMRAVQNEIVEFVKESGIDPQTIRQLYESDPAIRSAPFQKIIYDAMRFRAAQRTATANPASRDRIPHVAKPGISRTRGEIAAAELDSLRRSVKNSEGQDQIKAAVRYMQAKRAARG